MALLNSSLLSAAHVSSSYVFSSLLFFSHTFQALPQSSQLISALVSSSPLISALISALSNHLSSSLAQNLLQNWIPARKHAITVLSTEKLLHAKVFSHSKLLHREAFTYSICLHTDAQQASTPGKRLKLPFSCCHFVKQNPVNLPFWTKPEVVERHKIGMLLPTTC